MLKPEGSRLKAKISVIEAIETYAREFAIVMLYGETFELLNVELRSTSKFILTFWVAVRG